jgi:hypothetical protein
MDGEMKQKTGIVQFLKALQLMVCEDGTEYPAPWHQVPEEYQNDFKSWCHEYKQQAWGGMWEKGWFNYRLEYIKFVVGQMVSNVERGITEPWIDMDKQFGDLFPSDESEGRGMGVAKKMMSELVFAIRLELNEHPFVGEDCEAFAMLDELQEGIDKMEID